MSLIIPANSAAASGGYAVANSCRFNSGSSDSLTITPSSASNRKTWTWSSWVKRSVLTSGDQSIFNSHTDAQNQLELYFNSDDSLYVTNRISNTGANLRTNAKFRDVGAWYHIVLSVDTTQGTDTNRMKLYVNGVQVTSFSETGYPGVNTDTAVNNNVQHRIGDSNLETFFNGYIAEAVLIDGQALAPDQFGEFDEDSGIWKPIDVSGLTFGTNGFYLETKQSGTSQNSSGLGADTSGNDNHFAVNNLTAIDQTTDTCTNNFATLNPLFKQDGVFSEGNLAYTIAASDFDSGVSTFGASSGKWYFETKITATASGTTRNSVGICDARDGNYIAENEFGQPGSAIVGDTVGYTGNSSTAVFKNNSSEYSGTTYTTNDILCCAVDLDNGAVYYRKNGGSFLNSGDPTSGSSRTGAVTITTGETYLFGNTAYAGSAFAINFGSPPYSESGGETDGNGYGNFNQAVPSGYYALNTKNLAEYG